MLKSTVMTMPVALAKAQAHLTHARLVGEHLKVSHVHQPNGIMMGAIGIRVEPTPLHWQVIERRSRLYPRWIVTITDQRLFHLSFHENLDLGLPIPQLYIHPCTVSYRTANLSWARYGGETETWELSDIPRNTSREIVNSAAEAVSAAAALIERIAPDEYRAIRRPTPIIQQFIDAHDEIDDDIALTEHHTILSPALSRLIHVCRNAVRS
jgi:hypothetical protein